MARVSISRAKSDTQVSLSSSWISTATGVPSARAAVLRSVARKPSKTLRSHDPSCGRQPRRAASMVAMSIFFIASKALRVFTLLRNARPVLLNFGDPGGFDITPRSFCEEG
jgi:hypothetical protein